MSSARGHRLLCALIAAAAGLTVAVPARAQDHPSPPAGQYPSLKISGFGDINFGRTTNAADTKGFTLGQLALHMISQLSPRVTFFGEISFSPRTDAGTGSPAATGFNVEVERMILRFDHSDRLKVSFGRYHTPINYWNTAFHHGAWLQTTITRPEMIRFGSQFLPVHFIGGLVEGSVPAAGWNLNYKAGLGNGRSAVISRAGDAGDANEKPAWLANLSAKPDRAYGLEFGAAVYGDSVERLDRTFDEQIVSGHFVWHKEAPEVIAEVAGVRHRDPDTSLVTWNQGRLRPDRLEAARHGRRLEAVLPVRARGHRRGPTWCSTTCPSSTWPRWARGTTCRVSRPSKASTARGGEARDRLATTAGTSSCRSPSDASASSSRRTAPADRRRTGGLRARGRRRHQRPAARARRRWRSWCIPACRSTT